MIANQVAIYGASGFGREVMPLAQQQWSTNGQEYKLTFVDDNFIVGVCNGRKVMTYDEWLAQPAHNRFINIAIANGSVRKRLVDRCANDRVNFFEVRASNVIQLDSVMIGVGAILCPFVTLTSNIQIGNYFHANLYSYIAHDCIIGDYVTFAPGVQCNGNVVIEDYAYIGAGAVIKQGLPGSPLVIGRGAVVGMGAVVTKSVPPGVTVVGNPARQINT